MPSEQIKCRSILSRTSYILFGVEPILNNYVVLLCFCANSIPIPQYNKRFQSVSSPTWKWHNFNVLNSLDKEFNYKSKRKRIIENFKPLVPNRRFSISPVACFNLFIVRMRKLFGDSDNFHYQHLALRDTEPTKPELLSNQDQCASWSMTSWKCHCFD